MPKGSICFFIQWRIEPFCFHPTEHVQGGRNMEVRSYCPTQELTVKAWIGLRMSKLHDANMEVSSTNYPN